MPTRTNKKKSPSAAQREGKLGGPGYTRKSVAARRKILRAVVKKYGYRSALSSIMGMERSATISATARRALASDRVFLRETFGATAMKKYEGAMARSRTAQRLGKTGAQQNIIVLLLGAGFKVRGDVASYKLAGGMEGVAKLPKTLAEAKALVARKKRRESDVRRAARSATTRRLPDTPPRERRARRAYYGEKVKERRRWEADQLAKGILPPKAPLMSLSDLQGSMDAAGRDSAWGDYDYYKGRIEKARARSATQGNPRQNPFVIDDYIIAQIVTAIVGYLGKRSIRELAIFNALPRDERRPKLIAALKSKKALLMGGPISGPAIYLAAKEIAKSPRLVEHLLDLIEEYGPAAAEHATNFATTKLIRKNSLRIRTGRTATVTTYLNPEREECPTHGVPLLNGRCIPCEYENDVGMKTNRRRK